MRESRIKWRKTQRGEWKLVTDTRLAIVNINISNLTYCSTQWHVIRKWLFSKQEWLFDYWVFYINYCNICVMHQTNLTQYGKEIQRQKETRQWMIAKYWHFHKSFSKTKLTCLQWMCWEIVFSGQDELGKFTIAEKIRTYYIYMCMKTLIIINISVVEGTWF